MLLPQHQLLLSLNEFKNNFLVNDSFRDFSAMSVLFLHSLPCTPQKHAVIGSLSRDVFERRTSTGSELFSLLVCLDANKFVLLSFFSPLKTIYSRVSTKPLPNDAKSSLPVDVRRSKTLLLKLPNVPVQRESTAQ